MRSGDFEYRIKNSGAVLLEYAPKEEGAPGTDILKVPGELGGFPVREIAQGAFKKHGMLLSAIELPKEVRRIGALAFSNCVSLTSLSLNEGLEYIGANCLYITAVEKLFIPSTVREIASPSDLGEFSWEVDAANPWYESDGFGLYKKDPGTGEKFLAAVQKNRDIKEYAVLAQTVSIENAAFEGQMHIKRVYLPEGLIKIGPEAFISCQELEEISLPSTLKRIEEGAFRCCVRLREIDLPASVSYIGSRALTDTYGWSDRLNGIEYIKVKEGNPRYFSDENALFENTADGAKIIKYFGTSYEYRIPENVHALGEASFRRAALRHIILPKTVKYIGKDAFKECARLESIYIESEDVNIYIPRSPVYRKDEVSRLFSSEGGELKYDFAAYDALLKDWSQMTVRCRMAAFRLGFPKDLSKEDRDLYKSMILENMEELLSDIAKRDDAGDLSALTASGVFTKEGAGAAAEYIARYKKPKLTGYMMEYKLETFGADDEDDLTL